MNGMPEDPAKVLAQIDDLGTWKTYNHYPVGWAHAMDTPFQWTKQIASHYGGTRNGTVISWPVRIQDRGGLRSHHRTQYFEIGGDRAIYRDGWVAATTPQVLPWEPPGPTPDVLTGYRWERYDTSKDFSEADDLAASRPERLRSLQELFLVEVARHGVLPLDNRKVGRFDTAVRPGLTRGRTSFSYSGGMVRIPSAAGRSTWRRASRSSSTAPPTCITPPSLHPPRWAPASTPWSSFFGTTEGSARAAWRR
jgi:hypothetical protein